MAFLLTILVLAGGLLISLGTANRNRHRRLAQSMRHTHRRQLEDAAREIGLPLDFSPLGARIAGTWQGREVVLQVLSGGGLGAEAEADLALSLHLRHRLPPGSQLWQRGQPGPDEKRGQRLPPTRGVMLRTDHPRQLSALVSRPGTVAALTTFFDAHPQSFIDHSTIEIHRRYLGDLPAQLLTDAARLAAVLEEGIEVPWRAAAHRMGLTPETLGGALEMTGTRDDLPVHIQLLEDPVAVRILIGLRLPPESGIQRRSRGQLGGESTGNPIADQLLIVCGPITEALRSPECTVAAMEAIHGLPGSQVDADGVCLMVREIALEELPGHLDAAVRLALQLAPYTQSVETSHS